MKKYRLWDELLTLENRKRKITFQKVKKATIFWIEKYKDGLWFSVLVYFIASLFGSVIVLAMVDSKTPPSRRLGPEWLWLTLTFVVPFVLLLIVLSYYGIRWLKKSFLEAWEKVEEKKE